jgi:hypothetical protein
LLVVPLTRPVRPDRRVLLVPREEAVLVAGTRSREGSP